MKKSIIYIKKKQVQRGNEENFNFFYFIFRALLFLNDYLVKISILVSEERFLQNNFWFYCIPSSFLLQFSRQFNRTWYDKDDAPYIFESFLRSIYTDWVIDPKSLLAASNKYLLPKMSAFFTTFLVEIREDTLKRQYPCLGRAKALRARGAMTFCYRTCVLISKYL